MQLLIQPVEFRAEAGWQAARRWFEGELLGSGECQG